MTYFKGILAIISFVVNHFSILYSVVCLSILLLNLFCGYLSLDCSCLEISNEEGSYALNMNANDGGHGQGPTGAGGGGNGPTNQPGGWPKWPGSFSEGSRVEGSPLDNPRAYNPANFLPPANKQELATLLQHKVAVRRAMTGMDSRIAVSVGGLFQEDNVINRTVKSMLYNHINENSLELSAAYRQLGVELGRTEWSRVGITSKIITSLYNSQ